MVQRLRQVSQLWLWLMVLLFAQAARAQLLTEDFAATTLPYSLTSQGWSTHSGAGTNSVQATSPSLSYAGLATTGGAVGLTVTGEDVNRTFAQQTTGPVYASFLVNVSSAQTTGDYFLHFGATAIGTAFGGRVFVRSTTEGIQFGISKATDTGGPVYSPTVYSLNTTYFLVLKYTVVSGTANDIAGLYIEPVLNQPEPSTGLSTTSTAGDIANVGSIALRQGGGASIAPNVRVDYIRVATNWADVTKSSTPVAALSVNPTTLTGYVATQGTASSSQSYTLTGTTLDASAVSVSATAGIELSTDNVSFGPTLSITPASGSVSQPVYARLTSSAATGPFSGTITNTSNTTLVANVTVTGQVNAPNTPSLTATPTALTGFTATQGTASLPQTFTVSGANLTPSSITVTAASGFEVSLDASSSYTNQFTFGSLPNSFNVTVYTRLAGSASAGLYNGSVVVTSGSNLTATVSVNGTVNSNSPYTPIAIARANIGQTYTIQGRVTVTNQLGSRQIYIQDETGGIVVYASPSGTDLASLVQIGDLVQARGPISVFSGYTEITSPAATSFTVVSGAGTVVPTPIAITPDQLPNYQGQLVSIANANISGTGNFAGGASYTITAGGQSGVLRISANSPLAGAGRPSNPVSVTGIADRFVSGATTPGTNGLQFQPRILADIPGSTAAQDATCGNPAASPLAFNKTLDVAAWNMEFFGADAGTISCPNNVTLTYNDMGPTNEDLQQTNGTTVLNKLNADIVAVEEISDINRFAAAVAAIPGSYSYVCSNRFSYYFQDECDQVPSGGTVFGPTSLAQKVCVIYNTATVTPVLAETKPLLDGMYNYPSGNGWSSGRLPFLFVANVTIDGITKKVHVVAIHAKSGSATADYNRRRQDVSDLKAKLDSDYPNANVIILGDYNDKLNGSIAANQQSSYASFVNDASNYTPLTLPLENQGCSTFNSSASFIDHMIVSNDLQPAYIANSTYVLQPFSIPNYANTTSDHNPIIARFDLTKLVTPNTAPTVATTIAPQSATVGAGFSYTIPANTFTDVETPNALTLSVSSLPAGLSFTAPATISGTPSTTVSSPFTITVTATDPGNLSVSTSFTLTVSPTVIVTPGSFAIASVTTVNCATVSAGERNLTFNPVYTGATSAPIAFSVVNELTTTTTAGPYTLRLYTDNPVITLKAVQDGNAASFTYNWLAACSGTPPMNTAPTVANTIASQSATVSTSFSYTIPASTFTDAETPNGLTLSVSGLPAGLSFTAPATISGTPSTTVGSPFTITVTATDPGNLSASTSFTLTVSPAGVVTPGAFTIARVSTLNCEVVTAGERNVTFTPVYTGSTGSPITFSVINERIPTTNPGPYTLRLYTDNPVITLKAEQAGTVATFSYNWLAACSPNTRVGVIERSEPLSVTILGNPVLGESVDVEIRGASGTKLQVQTIDSRGRGVSSTTIDKAGVVERASVSLGRSTGVYFLQVSTPTQKKVLKLVKE